MIWHGPSSSERDSSILTAFLVSETRQACGDLPIPDERLHDVASSVADYCLQQLRMTGLPVEALGLLLARALWGVGEETAAARVVGRLCGKTPAGWLAHAAGSGDAGWAWRLADAGIVRHGAWLSADAEGVWVLDLDRVHYERRDPLELEMFGEVRTLLRGAAHVWDGASGSGCLGIRGLRRRSAAVMRSGERKRKTKQLATEARSFAEGVLERVGRERGWSERPRVLVLDV